MPEEDAGVQVNLRAVDFDAVYQGASPFEGIDYGGIVPWDISGPQPAVVDFEKAGCVTGEVLDVGCGTGDNSIYLATRGYSVTGVDCAPTAIEKARERAREQGVKAEFAVADATDLSEYEGRFDTVVDSALFHCFEEDEQRLYTAALWRATKPAARLNLLCFSDAMPAGIPGPPGISEESMRKQLAASGWSVTEMRRHTFLGRAPQALVDQVGQLGFAVESDEEGRLRLPAWAVTARRV